MRRVTILFIIPLVLTIILLNPYKIVIDGVGIEIEDIRYAIGIYAIPYYVIFYLVITGFTFLIAYLAWGKRIFT